MRWSAKPMPDMSFESAIVPSIRNKVQVGSSSLAPAIEAGRISDGMFAMLFEYVQPIAADTA